MRKLKILLLSLFTLISFTLMAQSPMDVIEKHQGEKGVDIVIVNEELFNMIESMEMDMEKEAKDIIEGLENMVVLSTTKFEIEKELDLTIYDNLMNINEGFESVKIYGKIKNEKIKELLILTNEPEKDVVNYTMIYIEGNLKLEDIGKIAKSGDIKIE